MGDTPGLAVGAVCNLDIGLYKVKEALVRKTFLLPNATGAVISQEPQDFPFFLHPLAEIFCFSNNSSVFI